MLVVRAPADIRTWIYKYKVSATAIADNDDAIRMTFPMNGLEILAVLSRMKPSKSGYNRTLEAYVMKNNHYGISIPGNCLMVGTYNINPKREIVNSTVVLTSTSIWSDISKNTAKNIMEAAANTMSAIKFLTVASSSKKLAANLNINVLDSGTGCWDIFTSSSARPKDQTVELEMTELYKTFEQFWNTPQEEYFYYEDELDYYDQLTDEIDEW